MVPSWTETLLWAEVPVVGRTRFCIHPADQCRNIEAVGGTKDVDWQKIERLQPDLVLLDKEENTEIMAQRCPLPWFATHVTSIHSLPQELENLSRELQAPKLQDLAQRWQKVLSSPHPLKTVPAELEWVKKTSKKYDHVVYVIWAHPWMAASQNTFIGSMCSWLGWDIWKGPDQHAVKYPEFNPQDFVNAAGSVLFLCSSEPYPFLKKRQVLKELPGDVALVDGEKLSWFGLRSLKYLESFL